MTTTGGSAKIFTLQYLQLTPIPDNTQETMGLRLWSGMLFEMLFNTFPSAYKACDLAWMSSQTESLSPYIPSHSPGALFSTLQHITFHITSFKIFIMFIKAGLLLAVLAGVAQAAPLQVGLLIRFHVHRDSQSLSHSDTRRRQRD